MSESPPAPTDLGRLERALGHYFRQPHLLVDALTHRSYAYEFAGPGVVSNERLEFLGDAVLGLIASDLLFRAYPEADEGQLTNLRAALVRASTLGALARRLDVGPHLRLGRGEEATGGRERELLLARAVEALIGAVYLDAGLDSTRAVLEPLLKGELEHVATRHTIKDNKSLLQELAQARLGITPHYRLVSEEGPSHDRTFTVEVVIGELVAGRGSGRSKRQAEQAAAKEALRDEGWAPTPAAEPAE